MGPESSLGVNVRCLPDRAKHGQHAYCMGRTGPESSLGVNVWCLPDRAKHGQHAYCMGRTGPEHLVSNRNIL